VLVTRHAVLPELTRVLRHIAETSFVRRLRSRIGAPSLRAGSKLAASGDASRR
jgi:hypothetical protein